MKAYIRQLLCFNTAEKVLYEVMQKIRKRAQVQFKNQLVVDYRPMDDGIEIAYGHVSVGAGHPAFYCVVEKVRKVPWGILPRYSGRVLCAIDVGFFTKGAHDRVVQGGVIDMSIYDLTFQEAATYAKKFDAEVYLDTPQ